MKKTVSQNTDDRVQFSLREFLWQQKKLFSQHDPVGELVWKGIIARSEQLPQHARLSASVNGGIWLDYAVVFELFSCFFRFHLDAQRPGKFWRSRAAGFSEQLEKLSQASDVEQQLSLVAGDVVLTLMNKKINYLPLKPRQIIAVADFFAKRVHKSSVMYAKPEQAAQNQKVFITFLEESFRDLQKLHQNFISS